MSADLYDVVIVGAGPAGATAATFLAKTGDQVVLVDRATFPRDMTCTNWLSARAAPLLTELGVRDKTLLKRAFRDVTFYRADLSQSAKPRFEEAPGYLIDRAKLGNALVTTAIDHGVTFIQGRAVADFQLKESSAVIELTDGQHVEGKLLVLASGSGSKLVERAGFNAGTEEPPIWRVQVDAPLTAGMLVGSRKPRVGVILDLGATGSFAFFCVSQDRASITVDWVGESSEAIPALVSFCRRAFEHEAVPLDLAGAARSARPIRGPRPAALDMESHVGKHTLLIGEAGGFVSAASNESLWPAMWSGQIAAEVTHKALHSSHSQDELMTFDSAWRMRMADYLRSPHTDLQFLLPLIFTNQPMADRMGAAFFSGENI